MEILDSFRENLDFFNFYMVHRFQNSSELKLWVSKCCKIKRPNKVLNWQCLPCWP